MPLSDVVRKLINNAWDDGYPCLVATTGKDGPNISVKGSMIVFDDQHLSQMEVTVMTRFRRVGAARQQ